MSDISFIATKAETTNKDGKKIEVDVLDLLGMVNEDAGVLFKIIMKARNAKTNLSTIKVKEEFPGELELLEDQLRRAGLIMIIKRMKYMVNPMLISVYPNKTSNAMDTWQMLTNEEE